MSVLLPGDTLTPAPSRIGPGLHLSSKTVSACRAGLLQLSSHAAHLDASETRYVTAQGDSVIGQVTARFAEGYRVNIAANVPATLDALAFHNVNRKSRPNVPIGGTVFARVSHTMEGMEPEVQCVTGDGKAGGFGVLEGGFLIQNVKLGLCRRLQSKGDVTLACIGERVEYEVVVGMNGRIWVNAEDKKTLLLIVSILRDVEYLTEGEVRELIQKRLKDV